MTNPTLEERVSDLENQYNDLETRVMLIQPSRLNVLVQTILDFFIHKLKRE